MCSRYYINNEALDETIKLFPDIKYSGVGITAHDVRPSEMAPILARNDTGFVLDEMRWGFPQFGRKGLIINARSETALEKRIFSESVLQRRCVIPARHFYEWDARKDRHTFQKGDGLVLYMAGFYNLFDEELRFVILTTQANTSMQPVHDRMPLILERNEVESWICDDAATQFLLKKTPLPLKQYQDYEQQSLFSL